ncbi:S-adenosyl-L-methionine-dependent methyltransferase [Rhodofomes roseus]|uniref:S-adenosyl-L-methionine-dependent methyltransferase n=1 Tax=Rhodofomes roseus TaxID=34475 RepID=A0ABQ8KHL2_9APHY|nr:S-adenosyl-L-methionine-dependent methyltransferase [Rhodofomes roseus]KAH9837354.1 S-adenosyl-L-methionine-dependent methyltransferase [Rhodofomes roseus]
MPHHPFSAEDAPYIQSYSPTALDSDYHTFELLRRLNTNSNSPTFHEYGRRPPTNVLDLGCGEGHWVLFAARAWKSAGTHVTGLDLIDLYNNDHGRVSRDREAEVPPRNVTFVRSNFLKYRLPFHNNSFDLVRMANLALVVPYWTWDFVLSEITRVLCPGGRLELVDDQLFFPRIPSIEELRGYQIPSPIDPDLSPNLWQDLINARHDAQAVRKIWETQPSSAPNTTNRPHSPGKGHKRSQSEADYEASARVAGQLEDTFMCMLVRKYQYGTRTYEYIILALEHYFSQAKMAHEFRLGVPSREFVERSEARESAKRPTRRPRYSEGDIPIPTSSPRIRSFDSTATSKALRVLVGDAESSRPPKPPQPYQPPGLILLPTSLNKLLPFSPAELEMHACKNMHTLLSCKNALTKHIKEQTDKDGEPLFSEDEVNDYLFDYDQFRRKRFNWPMDYPGLRMDEDPVESSPRTPLLRLGSTSSSFQGRDRSSSNPLSPRKLKTKTERAIEVRVVRVYHAIKAADGSSTMSLV